MNNRALLVTLLIFTLSFKIAYAYDWGKTGHRATAQIAESYLTKKTKKKINKLLDGQGLAIVSTFADDIKSDRDYKSYSPWHYVNFDFDKKYGEEKPNEFGDLVSGINKCVSVLKNESSTDDEKRFYLKMLVHFIGDLHQPLHVGRGEDKGGNDIQVRWFDEGSNLHRVWDSDMIDNYKMSYSELAANADEFSNDELNAVKDGDILDWIYESQSLAMKIYASAEVGEKLGYRYMYDYFPIVREQIQKGGIRLAKVLNEIFD